MGVSGLAGHRPSCRRSQRSFMRSMNDEVDRGFGRWRGRSTGSRAGCRGVGVTARMTPPSITMKPMTPTTMSCVETPTMRPPSPTSTRIVP